MTIFIDASFSLQLSNQSFVELAGEVLEKNVRWEEIPQHQAAVCFSAETGVLRVVMTPEELEYFQQENASRQTVRLYLVALEELSKASYTYRQYLERKQKEGKGEKKRCKR